MPRSTKPPELQGPTGDTLYEKIKGKLVKPTLSREHALNARPIRNPGLKWEELEGGEVRIILPRRKDAMGKLLSAVFYVPESRPVNLDLVGASVWLLCDGEHTVEDMVRALMDEHRLHRREAEVSLTEFLRMLGKRNMVAFAVPTEYLKADAAGKPGAKTEKGEAARASAEPKKAPAKKPRGKKAR